MNKLLRGLVMLATLGVAAPVAAQQSPHNPFVRIPAGAHVPFYGDGAAQAVPAFELQRDPVSVAEYATFIATDPRWQPARIARVYADAGYLRDWQEGVPAGDQPVVNVSWFAARAYCASLGGRLPTTLEWEYVAAASETERDASANPQRRAELLRLYTTARSVPSGTASWYGVRAMHGGVREWVLDFNSVMTSDDARSSTAADRGLFCAAGAANARDPGDYAAFLRYALRGSLNARSTVSSVGFRCAR